MIDVALTRADLRHADVAVVIDVLRATSTATVALAAGYRSVLCAESIGLAISLRADGRVLAGERRCVMPPGFDIGNSPLEAARRRGEQLVLATTNGAPAIVAASAHAPTVLLACLLNLDAVLGALRRLGAQRDQHVQIACAGTGDAPALEDAYVAGRLCAQLEGRRSDAALMAEAVARAYPTPFDALAASANAAVLRNAGLERDIEHCARVSCLDVVPSVLTTSAGVVTVVDRKFDASGHRAGVVAEPQREPLM